MKIAVKSLTHVLNELPEIEQIDQVIGDDLFVAVQGFEPRAVSVPRHLAATGYRCKAAYQVQYRNKRVDNSGNLVAMQIALGAISETPPVLVSDADIGKRIRSHVLSIAGLVNREIRVRIDLSGASVALIMEMMHILMELPVDFRICYAEAELYYPTLEEYRQAPRSWVADESLKTESGVGSVCTTPVYPGQHSSSIPHGLIIVPNFNPARAKAMQAWIDEALLTGAETSVTWLLGVPHIPENSWRCQALKEINEIEDSCIQMEVSTFDYKDMIRVLEFVREGKWRTQNLTIAMLGSKLQAIGASLFCEMHPEIRVMVSSPTEYRQKRYSEGCRSLWQIQFGSSAFTRNKLLTCGELEILPD